jgi:hypothetical protein
VRRAEARNIPTWLVVPIAVLAVIAIYLTTPSGQRLAGVLGVPVPFGKGPAREDRDYLLRACGGDRREMARRLAMERARFPDLGEAEIHRRAIRTYMNDRSATPEEDEE